jgi:hypothetical protein
MWGVEGGGLASKTICFKKYFWLLRFPRKEFFEVKKNQCPNAVFGNK